MGALLLKDLYVSWRYYKVYFLIVVAFSILSVWAFSNTFVTAYPFMLVSLIPLGLQNFDETSKWDVYCGTMPCSKAQVVCGKYLIGLVFAALALLLNLAAQIVRMELAGEMNWQELGDIMSVCLILTFLCPTVSMPLVFRFGSAKGRIGQYVIIGLVCGGAAFMSKMREGNLPTLFNLNLPIWVMVLVTAVLYIIAWLLSIRFYEKREIR